jgi:ribosomal-protein-alanine acetyltransferase
MHGEEAKKGEGLIREFRSDVDAGAVAEILHEAKEAADWPEAELRGLESLAGVSAFVGVGGNAILGFVVGRRVLDEAEILNLAIRAGARRQGEGRKLVMRLLEEFRKNRVSRVFLEVRESNKGAIAFYEQLGFRAAGERKGYYQDPPEAAVVMEAWLRESTD